MVKVFCDKCKKDSGLNAYAITVEIIHNPAPYAASDMRPIKITDDSASMRFCLCQECYGELGFPNIYDVMNNKRLEGFNANEPASKE